MIFPDGVHWVWAPGPQEFFPLPLLPIPVPLQKLLPLPGAPALLQYLSLLKVSLPIFEVPLPCPPYKEPFPALSVVNLQTELWVYPCYPVLGWDFLIFFPC